MELTAKNTLGKALKLAEQYNGLVEEIRTIENRKKALQEQMIDSAMENKGEGRANKEILGLEKVIETMTEQLDKKTMELGEKMKELKSIYRERAEQSGLGKISEAVPE